MDAALRRLLIRLFDHVQSSGQVGVPTDPTRPGPFMVSRFGGEALQIGGEAFDLLEQIQEGLARSALSTGGPSKRLVSHLVMEACREALRTDPQSAVTWLEAQLSERNSQWQVIEPIRGIFPKAPFRLGRTTLHPALPPELARRGAAYPITQFELDRPVLVANVEARDEESAQRRARDLFDEARSILTIAGKTSAAEPPLITINVSDGHTWLTMSSPTEDFAVSDRAFQHPVIRAIEVAAAREPMQRNEWERRCLAACRWFRRARAAEWPSESLAACMTLLECLFVEGRSVPRKGEAIADWIAPRWRLAGLLKESEMREWIIGMYRQRNDAVHEGASYLEDVEVARLVTLARQSTVWAGWHLHPDHDHHSPERVPLVCRCDVPR